MRAQFRFRIRVILALVLAVALLVALRLYAVQIVHGNDYALKADHQFTAAASGLFDRGTIYFTRKDGTLISAASLASGFLVAINPQTLSNPQAAYAAVGAAASSSVMVDQPTFLADAAKKSQVYIEVAHHLPEAAGEALSAQAIPGVSVLRERWRYYPGGSVGEPAIGFVSYGSGDALSGQTGLEASYDTTLERSGDTLYQNFFAQIFSNVGNLLVSARDATEGDVVTTIEPDVETRLALDLANVTKQYGSVESGGIIMDPKTGAIIALATYPTYDPNNLAAADPSLLRDPLVENVYEFGSIMKPLTMAAGLDAGVITPDSTYTDTGCITVDRAQICNFDLKARGVTGMVAVIEHSLNVGASWIVTELGQDRFRSYFMNYFGAKTGVDLPGEQKGLIANLNTTQQVNFDNMSFGQGIAVTPVAMMRALAALANGGVMETPHLVSAVELDSGITKPLSWPSPGTVFSAQTAAEVTKMLITVYPNDARLAINANPSLQYASVPVAAKTGTAQVEKPGGGYYTNVYFHSFFGFFPAYAPRFAILLYTDRPQGVQYASGTLTATFMDLTNFLMGYYAIPPDPANVIPLPAKVAE